MNRELLLLVDALSREKNVPKEIVFTALEAALASATKKKYADNIDARVSINRETGVTVLLVSHDLNMVQVHAHDVLCLRGGAIQCQGPPNEILTPINMSLVFGAEIHMFPHRFGT